MAGGNPQHRNSEMLQ